MSAKTWAIAAATLLLAGWAVRAVSQETARPDEAVSHADLQVSLEHVGGKVDTFADRIVRMELILDPAGRLDQVHLITRTGQDADTHIWYNVDNLVLVRYRFLEITGRGKVTVRTITPLPLAEPAPSSRKQITPLDAEDYR